MAKGLAGIDAHAIEQAAREVEGVAFAEVSEQDGRMVLRIVLWRDAPVEETAGLVELALNDSLGLTVAGGDVVIAGHADPPEVALPPGAHGDVRVIDLGEKTWATETVGSTIPAMPADGAEDAGNAAASMTLLSVTVSRTRERCSARVEVESPDGIRAGESGGPATGDRVRRVVCEAAAQAAALALGIPAPDVQSASTTVVPEPCALVVVEGAGESAGRGAGAALLGDDAWHAFAAATLQAVAALVQQR